MIVTSVPSGDDADVMSLCRWPLTETCLLDSLLLVDLISRFYKFHVVDPDSNSLLGVPKAPYNFSIRRQKTSTLVTKSKCLLQQSSIRLVSSKYCCLRKCCQSFPWEKTLTCRTRYWALSFDERRVLGRNVFKRLHAAQGEVARKLIILHGVDVYQIACWKIYGVSRATSMVYRRKSRMDFVSSVHGNAGFLRPRRHVVQAEASMQSVMRMNADLMPHQMKSLGASRQDVRMVLPSELNWKRMQEDANEVISFGFFGSVFLLLLLLGDRTI